MTKKIEIRRRRRSPTSHKRVMYYLIPLLLAVGITLVTALFGYDRLLQRWEREAQEQLWPMVYLMKEDKYKEALEGDGIMPGLLELTKTYPNTQAVQQAYLYISAIYIKQGEYEKAIEFISKFTVKVPAVWSRMQGVMGDAHRALGREKEAIRCYKQAIAHKQNRYFTPYHYQKLAQLYEKQGKLKEALAAYEAILEKYPTTPFLQEATLHEARLRALCTNSKEMHWTHRVLPLRLCETLPILV